MLRKETLRRQAIEMLYADMLAPPEHLLQKNRRGGGSYDLVEDLYCGDNGRPCCDPVVLFKLMLIQYSRQKMLQL